jgi:anti-sigma B factor antagonist
MPQDPLTIEDIVGSSEGQRILRLKGPLLINNLFSFQEKVRSDTSRNLVLDFSGVPYIDSAGIGALVGAYVNRQKAAGRSLALVGVNDRVHTTMKITHIDHFFRFFSSVEEVEQAVA